LSQYYFQQEIEHLFEQEGVAGLIPDLGIRGRSQQAFADLQDLGIQPAGQPLQVQRLNYLKLSAGFMYQKGQL
jgi:heme oxygenase